MVMEEDKKKKAEGKAIENREEQKRLKVVMKSSMCSSSEVTFCSDR